MILSDYIVQFLRTGGILSAMLILWIGYELQFVPLLFLGVAVGLAVMGE